LNIQNRQRDFEKLRKKYPVFTYQAYSYHEDTSGLHISFDFDLSGRFRFSPVLFIPKKKVLHWDIPGKQGLDNLIFHLGMIELISYWKLTCSPRIVIRPHRLNDDQVIWWKKLYFHGLGEFLYLNGIEVDAEKLMEIEANGRPLVMLATQPDMRKVMVPIGGGKDSVVTLEILKTGNAMVFPMAVNRTPAISRTIQQAGFPMDGVLEVHRKLDPLMLELNSKGFLNGHTPFSALLAFTSVFLAAGSGIGNIALSNESSANESTVPGTNINHQYSKSFEFEQDFDAYCRNYIHPEIRYFSFLRPLNELQIARVFSTFPEHHHGFRSCNVGSKEDRWCGACPKCLFTYLILAPFIPDKELVSIFGSNVMENRLLATYLDELTGKSPVKPFECVGTPEEVNAAINKAFHGRIISPLLIKDYSFNAKSPLQFNRLLDGFSDEHAVPLEFLNILKKVVHDQLA